MRIIPLIATYTIALMYSYEASCKIRDTSRTFLARQKRFLIFEEGVNWIQMVVGIGFPIELKDENVQIGATVKSYYLLPTNSNQILRPSLDIEQQRKRRSPNRWEIYSAIRDFIDRFSLGNGKSCLMRAICEAALAPFDQKSGILTEIVHILLTPSTTSDEVENYTDLEYHAAEKLGKETNNCARLFPECNLGFMEQLTRIFL